MEETLRSYGFTECADDEDTLEFVCPEECIESLAEALGVDEDTEVLTIQVYSSGSAMVYADGDTWDVTVEDILDAMSVVF